MATYFGMPFYGKKNGKKNGILENGKKNGSLENGNKIVKKNGNKNGTIENGKKNGKKNGTLQNGNKKWHKKTTPSSDTLSGNCTIHISLFLHIPVLLGFKGQF